MTKHRRNAEGPAVEFGHDEARYRATFHQAAIGIVHTAADETILDVNPAFCSMLGYERGDLLVTVLTDHFAPGTQVESGAADYAERLLGGEIAKHARIEEYRHRSGRSV